MQNNRLVLALAVASAAMFALPTVASAGNWHLEPTDGSTTGPNFTISSGAFTLTTTSGSTLKGTAFSGSGAFVTDSTTTGTISGGLTLTGLIGPLGLSCNSEGQPPGTVKTTALTFHLEKIDTETPGILITPNAGHFATYTCGGIKTVLSGNGWFGDITNKCSEELEKGTADWQVTAPGQQKYKQVTTAGTSFDLTSVTGGGGSVTSAIEASATLTLAKKGKVNCTLP